MALEAGGFPSDSPKRFVKPPQIGHDQEKIAETQQLCLHMAHPNEKNGRRPRGGGEGDNQAVPALGPGKPNSFPHAFLRLMEEAPVLSFLLSKGLYDADRG